MQSCKEMKLCVCTHSLIWERKKIVAIEVNSPIGKYSFPCISDEAEKKITGTGHANFGKKNEGCGL